MRLSIIVPILDSHEIVRRQILHYKKMDLADDIEIIFMDDGSDPPLNKHHGLKNLTIYPTHDKRSWSWPVARNRAAEIANSEYLFMADIDYIITKQVINQVLEFRGDRMFFSRQFGVLDENGNLVNDRHTLKSYGLKDRHFTSSNFYKGHRNNFVINKSLFNDMGGYNEDIAPYSQIDGPDSAFKRVWNKFLRTGKAVDYSGYRPTLYMIPNGRFCAFQCGMFHKLSRE